jgi:hypothetical protein
MEYTELNHYSQLPVEKFVECLGFKFIDGDGRQLKTDSLQINITKPGKELSFDCDGVSYWIDVQELQIHLNYLTDYISKLVDYRFGYILGTHAPFVTRGLTSAHNVGGYILWIESFIAV